MLVCRSSCSSSSHCLVAAVEIFSLNCHTFHHIYRPNKSKTLMMDQVYTFFLTIEKKVFTSSTRRQYLLCILFLYVMDHTSHSLFKFNFLFLFVRLFPCNPRLKRLVRCTFLHATTDEPPMAWELHKHALNTLSKPVCKPDVAPCKAVMAYPFLDVNKAWRHKRRIMAGSCWLTHALMNGCVPILVLLERWKFPRVSPMPLKYAES